MRAGYFRQVTLSAQGRSFVLTLLARRSRFFAGTRYLKRGLSDAGHVANEVESEQIVDDTFGGFAAFVQVRGSVPAFWHQETSMSVPKPPILMQARARAGAGAGAGAGARERTSARKRRWLATPPRSDPPPHSSAPLLPPSLPSSLLPPSVRSRATRRSSPRAATPPPFSRATARPCWC